MHKTATRLVNTLHERRVRSVVVGDLTGIRERIGYGSRMNQRLHQWAYSKFEHMLTCKAQLRGQAAQAGLGSTHVTDVSELWAQTQT
ncbi:IS200/IS605 family accessory protein TnpB-related protein [Salinibacter ruber]|uniref:IS200/IS605 family accessory protein TnpB-related protein n=1 Tax=Salinibacter ruber TaxID=146919 RepID=UPI0020742192